MHFSSATLLATLAASAAAYSTTQRSFAVNHFYGKGNLVSGRMDPIVDPGEASGHSHAVQGGSNFALTMSDTIALDSACTSSLVKNDKSNYWTPTLYFHDPKDGSFTAVDLFYMNVYYFFEPTSDKIQAFQPGHRMVVGNPTLRTPPATGGKSITDLSGGTPQPVQWTCPRMNTNSPLYPPNSDGLHGVGMQDPGNGGAGAGFPDQNCDGYASPLRADVHFPSCYNPAAGLDNYKENMQFPTNGNCPEGWIHTPHLFYEVYWNTPPFADRWTPGQGNQPFVLSNGDPTGYGLHGDFISGWDVDTLQQIIDNCDAGDGGMDKCPGLMGGLNDPSTSCNIPCPINEPITGPMSALPGNNPLGQWGVNGAAPAPPAPAQTQSTPATSAPAVVNTYPAQANPGGTVTTTTPAEGYPTEPKTTPVHTVTLIPTKAEAEGQSNTLATAYVSATTTVYTTVIAGEAQPTAVGEATSDISGWSLKGCFSDSLQNRVLTGIEFANIGNHQVTNTKCIAYCGQQGYSLAGTEYGGQCFCGNELVGSSPLGNSACDMPCEGNPQETCGGSCALTVYAAGGGKMMARSPHRHMHKHQAREFSF